MDKKSIVNGFIQISVDYGTKKNGVCVGVCWGERYAVQTAFKTAFAPLPYLQNSFNKLGAKTMQKMYVNMMLPTSAIYSKLQYFQ